MRLDVRGADTYVYTGTAVLDVARPAIVFIHGADHDHSVWNLQSRYFAHHGYAVIVPDLPGHGRSRGQALDSVEALADWVMALIDAVGTGPACLVGHSMGSLIALEAAATRPDRVSKVALLATAVPMPVSATLLGAARDDEPLAIDMINAWSHSFRGSMGGVGAPGLWPLALNRRLMCRGAPGLLLRDLQTCNAYQSGLERGSKLTCPVLMLLGERDQMTPPRAARTLGEAIPQARTVTLADTGHNMCAEQPGRVLDELRRFITLDSSYN